jgi:hypothetical protein
LSRPRIGQKDMPDLIRALLERDPNVFFGVFHVVDEAKLNASGMLRKNRKVHTVTHPSCA